LTEKTDFSNLIILKFDNFFWKNLISQLSKHYDVPDVVEFAIAALKKKEKLQTICALLSENLPCRVGDGFIS
jgi:hypothetical protein